MTDSSAQFKRWIIAASYFSVLVAVVLITAKLSAWLYTGSVSILASLVDSLMDSIASVINLFAVRYSMKPADDDHRFGHGKAESLAALAQSAFIVGSALFLLLYCVERLLNPVSSVVEHSGWGMGVMAFSIGITSILLLFQRHVYRMTGSVAVKADSLHYRSDLLVNISIIFALLATNFGWPSTDLFVGLLIALYIAYSAVCVGMEALGTLMDKELAPELDREIAAIAIEHPEVRGIHELRTRQSGLHYFIQMHIELDDHVSLVHAHTVADQVEVSIRERFPNSDVLIHQDPCGSQQNR
ncbi:MAG: cation diffusion facilitator family transporter [Halioglobus sp.]